VSCEVTTRIADGVACRTPDPEALALIRAGVERVVQVTDDEVEDAMRVIYEDTHNVAEGAAGTALAALMKERDRLRGHTAAIVLTGANVDSRLFAPILAVREASLRSS
jgi:threonine dehydratase